MGTDWRARCYQSRFGAIAAREISGSALPDHGLAEQFRSHVAHDPQLVRAHGLELDAVFGVFLWIINPAAVPGTLADGFGIADNLDAAALVVRRILEPDDAPT